MKTINCETGKKFKELGLTDSQMKWYFLEDFDQPILFDTSQQDCFELCESVYSFIDVEIEGGGSKILDVLPAYTLDEILEMLPDEIKGYDLTLSKRKNEFLLDYFTYYDGYVYLCELTSEKEFSFQNKNPVEAAAQLLIWCIENGYVTKEETNNEISTKD
jgi:hypothetical protein